MELLADWQESKGSGTWITFFGNPLQN